MRYFLDTEFIDDGHTIDLISIGIVAEDGREYYAENEDADLSRASEWVRENVLPHLWRRHSNRPKGNVWSRDGGMGGLRSRRHIASDIRSFCDPAEYGPPEFWGWCSAYDWVVVCQLYGIWMDKPEGWPSYIRDLQHELDRHGISDATLYEAVPQNSQTHHALADAQYIKAAYDAITHIGQIGLDQHD